MSDSFMDHIPSHEREKIRKRMRSPEAYEKLRESVKGPEDLERELERQDQLAEARLNLESNPEQKEKAKEKIMDSMDEAIDMEKLSPEAKKKLEEGKFTVAISSHPKTHHDTVVVMPEGKVQEKIPLKQSMSDQIISGLQMGA